MKATIYSHQSIIGIADLQIGDESMGGLFGKFIPTDYYFKNIQKYVWEFWSKPKPNYKKWLSLRLNVQLENGFFIFPVGGYSIDDMPEFPNEPKQIDIGGVNLDIFRLAHNSLLKPWYPIEIKQKLSFEDELQKEITLPKTLFGLGKSKDNHILVGTEVCAIANYGPSDDVLFEINKGNDDNNLAVVHLTWIPRKKEHQTHFPTTTFYKDFEDFSKRRMIPDSKE